MHPSSIGQDTWFSSRQEEFDSPRVYQHYSFLAQLVEQLTVNQFVAGSSPAEGAKLTCPIVEIL